MLYISRVLAYGQYYVMDTDDSHESIVSLQDLKEAVIDLGIEIKGVHTTVDTIGERYVTFVEPYQNPATSSRLQVKSKTLLGVDVVVHNDEIVAIRADWRIAPPHLTIRLSDYAKKMDGGTTVIWTNLAHETGSIKNLTVVVDDSFEFRGTVPSVFKDFVRWDVSEYHNDEAVKIMYSELLSSDGCPYEDWDGYIVDNVERRHFYYAIYVLNRADIREDWKYYKKVLSSLPEYAKIGVQVAERYNTEFESFASSPIPIHRFHPVYRSKAGKLAAKVSGGPFELKDFQYLSNRLKGIFSIISNASSWDFYQIRHFENYLLLFEPTDAVKGYYVALCNNFIRACGGFYAVH